MGTTPFRSITTHRGLSPSSCQTRTNPKDRRTPDQPATPGRPEALRTPRPLPTHPTPAQRLATVDPGLVTVINGVATRAQRSHGGAARLRLRPSPPVCLLRVVGLLSPSPCSWSCPIGTGQLPNTQCASRRARPTPDLRRTALIAYPYICKAFSLAEAPSRIQASDPQRRETLRVRTGYADIRRSPDWLLIHGWG